MSHQLHGSSLVFDKLLLDGAENSQNDCLALDEGQVVSFDVGDAASPRPLKSKGRVPTTVCGTTSSFEDIAAPPSSPFGIYAPPAALMCTPAPASLTAIKDHDLSRQPSSASLTPVGGALTRTSSIESVTFGSNGQALTRTSSVESAMAEGKAQALTRTSSIESVTSGRNSLTRTSSIVSVTSEGYPPVPTPPSSQPTTNNATSSDLERLMALAGDLLYQCRICWFRQEVSKPHVTYLCHTKVCSGVQWKMFKSQQQFPRGEVCFLCYATYGPPFSHDPAPQGDRYKGQDCEYPDVLKELSYIVYQDSRVRDLVFAELGDPSPLNMASYKRYIGKRQKGGLLGLYRVLVAYLDLREQKGVIGGMD